MLPVKISANRICGNGKLVYCTASDRVFILDSETGEEQFFVHFPKPDYVIFLKDGDFVLQNAQGRFARFHGSEKIWDAKWKGGGAVESEFVVLPNGRLAGLAEMVDSDKNRFIYVNLADGTFESFPVERMKGRIHYTYYMCGARFDRPLVLRCEADLRDGNLYSKVYEVQDEKLHWLFNFPTWFERPQDLFNGYFLQYGRVYDAVADGRMKADAARYFPKMPPFSLRAWDGEYAIFNPHRLVIVTMRGKVLKTFEAERGSGKLITDLTHTDSGWLIRYDKEIFYL